MPRESGVGVRSSLPSSLKATKGRLPPQSKTANRREYAVLQSKTRGGSEIWAGGLGVVGVLWAGARLGGKTYDVDGSKSGAGRGRGGPV